MATDTEAPPLPDVDVDAPPAVEEKKNKRRTPAEKAAEDERIAKEQAKRNDQKANIYTSAVQLLVAGDQFRKGRLFGSKRMFEGSYINVEADGEETKRAITIIGSKSLKVEKDGSTSEGSVIINTPLFGTVTIQRYGPIGVAIREPGSRTVRYAEDEEITQLEEIMNGLIQSAKKDGLRIPGQVYGSEQTVQEDDLGEAA